MASDLQSPSSCIEATHELPSEGKPQINLEESREVGLDSPVQKQDVEASAAFAATDNQTRDPLMVDWDGPNDPNFPLNWSTLQKAQ